MINRRSFLLGSAAAVAFATSGCSIGLARVTRPLRVDAAALSAPVEIVDDTHGVPHVRAASIPDAFFGQGYVVARDRLFQIDLSHRRDMGLMADAFGPAFAVHDARSRLFHYRGDLDRELALVPPKVLACARSYVAGINARIDEVLAYPALLPLEHRILGIRPLKWDLKDLVLARGYSTGGTVEDEVRRARLAGMGLLDLDALIAPLRPAWPLTVPEGLNAAAVTDADLGILNLGSMPYETLPTAGEPATGAASLADAGSNAWTVGPARTATGRTLLANDPHLGIGGFGPRHVVHLSAPGLDVIGGGAPGLAGIMQGHTDRFAFGRTNFHIDQEDLFILELNPDDPELYRHEGGWKRLDRVEISIPVKGAPPVTQTLRYAVQGPVVSYDPAKRRATALSAIELQSGASGSFAMIAINLARDWESLREAFPFHPSPTNFHYADVDGNHGWQVIGFQPIRRKGEGLMPVPGDGRYDWTGRRDFRELPSEYNPAKGWFASANQNNLPADWPRERITAFSFRDPYRYERIAEVLSAQPKHSIADSLALLQDTVSTPARQLIQLLPASGSADAQPAIAMLRNWNGRLDADSGPAALFQILWRELGKRMLGAIVPDRARELVTSIAPSVLLGLLANPDARLGANPAAARDALFDAALASAWSSAQQLMGPDPAAWRWGSLHKVRIAHPLSRIPAIAAAFPPIEGEGSGGDNFTVMARWIGGSGWQTTGGASYLQVVDVGAWDNSLMLNLPGQSNDPRSPHYRDHYLPWIKGQLKPMLFSRAAVDAAATARTRLVPGG